MKTRIIYGLLAGLFFSLYWLTWRGAVLFVGVLVAHLLAYLVIIWFHKRHNIYRSIIGIIVVGGIAAWVFVAWLIPRAFTAREATTVMELQSLNLLSAWHNFGILTFMLPVIFALLTYKAVRHGDASTILLLVWSAVMLVAMLEYRRYAYYFAINASLLAGWFIWYLWGWLSKRNLPKAIAVTAILCGLMVFPSIQQITTPKNYHTPPDAWCETLLWVKSNTHGDSLILAWWDYGYWIERIADRKAYIKGGIDNPKVALAADFFTSPIGPSPINFDYLILDYYTTTTYKFETISIWTDKQIEAYSPEYYQALAVKLYEAERLWEVKDELSYLYILVYQSKQKTKEGIPEVKVFKCRKVIVGQ